MLDENQYSEDKLNAVKRHLNITWSDEDTDEKLSDMMMDAEVELNHILGAEIDYFCPGMARRLYMNYMVYVWNECINEFEDAYRKEINRIRRLFKVKGTSEDEEQI